jgi:hypothetical protein
MGEGTDVKRLRLSDMHEGAAEELFQDALVRVLENVADPNTDYRAKRVIAMTFTFSVDEARKVGAVVVAATTKLAGVKGVIVPVYVGQHEGEILIVEAPSQREMFPTPKPAGPRRVAAAGEGDPA